MLGRKRSTVVSAAYGVDTGFARAELAGCGKTPFMHNLCIMHCWNLTYGAGARNSLRMLKKAVQQGRSF